MEGPCVLQQCGPCRSSRSLTLGPIGGDQRANRVGRVDGDGKFFPTARLLAPGR